MTEDVHAAIQQKAEQRQMSVSSYMVDAAIHNHETKLLKYLISFQTQFNHSIQLLKMHMPEEAVKLEKEMDELWSSLK